MLCDIAIADSAPGSLEHEIIQADERKIRRGEVAELRIPWYVPTRLAKTFHPRTMGQRAFAGEIMRMW